MRRRGHRDPASSSSAAVAPSSSAGRGMGRSIGRRRQSSVHGASPAGGAGAGTTGHGDGPSTGEAMRSPPRRLEAGQRRGVERAPLRVPDVIGTAAQRAPPPGVDGRLSGSVVDCRCARAARAVAPAPEAHAGHGRVGATRAVHGQEMTVTRGVSLRHQAGRAHLDAPRATSRRIETCRPGHLLAQHGHGSIALRTSRDIAGQQRADQRAAQVDERAVAIPAATPRLASASSTSSKSDHRP